MALNMLNLTVTQVDEVARDIRAFRLRAAANEPALPAFGAGAHLTLLLPSGLRRAYSLCSDPDDRDEYRIAVQREARGAGSRELHGWLRPGTEVTAQAPVNRFPLPHGDGPVLLLAGGIGVTPILSMVHALRHMGRRFRLIYLVAAPSRIAFREDLVPQGAEDITVHVRAESSGRLDLAPVFAGLGPAWSVMCCGPSGLLKCAGEIAQRLGWEDGRLRSERFRADRDTSDRAAQDRSFTVTLARSGRSVEVPPGRSILASLLEAGVDVDYSCEEGTCGTCITRVLDGVPDHRDAVLTPVERDGQIAICCSRAKSGKLTLDL